MKGNNLNAFGSQGLGQGQFVLDKDSGRLPSYFPNPFKSQAITVISTPGFYPYSDQARGQRAQYWVDFSNVNLGGGVFRGGFAQEEVMFLETPELANAAAQPPGYDVDTRIANVQGGAAAGPAAGSPNPWVFDDVNRVLNID